MPLRRALRRPSHTLLIAGGLLLGGWLTAGQAQLTTTIRPDGTLGTTVTQNGRVHDITGGTRPGDGPNLFHSFDRFSVGTNDTARFSGPSGIANILSRVTGGQGSSIDGLLQSGIPGANLYLLNPSGVLFGPNARLDVSGSFHVSTADYLRLADGAQFFANLGQESVLTVAPPAAFGFLGANPAPISIQQSMLNVPTGKVLSAVGGDITLTGGRLEAPSGLIQLASMASPGEVAFRPLELAPDLQVDRFARLGRIGLAQRAEVTVATTGSRNAGAIAVRSGQLTLSSGSRLSATTNGSGEGGRIVVTAPTISLSEESRIEAGTNVGSRGQGGTIEVRGGTLTLTGGARISSSTNGPGPAGTVTVEATEGITITGTGPNPDNGSGLSVQSSDPSAGDTNPRGDAGRIVVTAPTLSLMARSEITARAGSRSGNGGTVELRVGTLTLTDGANISTSTNGPGQAGPLTITAREAIVMGKESVLSIRSRGQGGGGAGGRLVIDTPRLSIGAGGLIRGGTLGGGPGGTIELHVGTLTLTDGGTISTSTSPTGTGPGGTIELHVGTLTLTDGGAITTSTEGPGPGGLMIITAREAVTITGQGRTGEPSRLSSNATGAGAAGRIVVNTPRLSLDGGTIRSETSRSGTGGSVHIQAGAIVLRDGGTITARSTGDGAAGTLVLDVGETFRSHNGRVTTASARAGGGRIELRAGKLVVLSDSELTTAVQGEAGDAGNLMIKAGLIFMGNSTVSANAFGGRGGNVSLETETFLADPASQVSASSELGIPGTVTLQGSVLDLSGTVTPLPQEFRPATALLHNRCAARLQQGAVSSLVARDRDGVPASPEGVLPSRLSSVGTGVVSSTSEAAVSRPGGVRPAGKGRPQGQRQYARNDPLLARDPACAAP